MSQLLTVAKEKYQELAKYLPQSTQVLEAVLAIQSMPETKFANDFERQCKQLLAINKVLNPGPELGDEVRAEPGVKWNKPRYILAEFPISIDSEKPKTIYIVVRLTGNVIVGMLRLEIDESAGWIGMVQVSEAHCNHGLGTLMLERAFDLCKFHQFQTVDLTVHNKNSEAQKLYRKLGFLQYLGGHEDYTQFVKVL